MGSNSGRRSQPETTYSHSVFPSLMLTEVSNLKNITLAIALIYSIFKYNKGFTLAETIQCVVSVNSWHMWQRVSMFYLRRKLGLAVCLGVCLCGNSMYLIWQMAHTSAQQHCFMSQSIEIAAHYWFFSVWILCKTDCQSTSLPSIGYKYENKKKTKRKTTTDISKKMTFFFKCLPTPIFYTNVV